MKPILRFSRTLLLAAALSMGALPAVAAEPPRGVEQYRGIDIALLAEATAQLTTLRTQHGEKQGAVEFERWLQGKGLSSNDYQSAYSSWFERFRADPTGQLEARFFRINAEFVQQLNYADAKDQRQEVREGVSLDTYAKVAVALSRNPAGAPLEKTLKQFGIKSVAQWERANTAWANAMKEDTTYTLVQQYGALYQKYAGPQFAAEQDAALANTLAAHNNAPAPAPEPKRLPPTIDEIAAKMAASDARAARCAKPVLKKELAPVILEAVERSDDDSIGFNVGLLSYLTSLGLVDDEARSTARRALNRAKDRLEVLQASFAPIKDKAVPERLPLRSKIDEYTSVIGDLEGVLRKW